MDNGLRFAPDVFDAYFNRRPFYLETSLQSHPAFGLERLIALSKRLRPHLVEYNGGDLPISIAPELTPRTGLSVEETLRRIEEAGSWMVLKRVDDDPEYRALMEDALAPVRARAQALVGRSFDLQSFIFISSPHAVTPLHMDPEHNVLVQIRGSKSFHVWDPDDRGIINETDLETFHAAFTHRNLTYKEQFAPAARIFTLKPGQALQVPVTVPHWVKNGPEVSISFSVTFRSDWTLRRERLYRVNARLRKLGIEPTPVGRNVMLDAAKLHTSETLVQLRRRLPFLRRKPQATTCSTAKG